MNEYMPTDIQFKDELRKEEIRIENELELLENKEYESKRQIVRTSTVEEKCVTIDYISITSIKS